MTLLGADGAGYDLAIKLETQGIWRRWLGESLYTIFSPSLSSPSSWSSFLSSFDAAVDSSMSMSKSKSDIQLQLRVRALLYDKASFSLFDESSSAVSSVEELNPSYLELHGDDVYFTLEDGVPPLPPRDFKVQSQRFKQEEFPETWYHQFIENYKSSRPYTVSIQNRALEKRNPSGMSSYLNLLERHKRRRIEFKGDENGGFGNSNSESRMQIDASLDDDTTNENICFFPETMFMMNSVPDSAVRPRISSDVMQKVEFNGVLDMLPKMVTKSSSSIMLERLGIRDEYLSIKQGSGQSHMKDGFDAGRQLGPEQAMHMSKKVVARVLTAVGFEGATEIPVEVLSQLLSCHISKLGNILKVLADSYRKRCSAVELIKMFLQAGGNSLATLAEHVKDTRQVPPQTSQIPQQEQSPQPQLSSLQQNNIQHPHQIPRQMHPQMGQIVRPSHLTWHQQQQLELLRRRQASPCPVMNVDKDRPMVEVKLENLPDVPTDTNDMSANNSRQAQMQFRQQQIAAIQKFGHHMRQSSSMQMPQMQSPNFGVVRAQPVKVEGFQELMGGDSSLKQNSDESKLTSPSK